jgi:hypothetical protein
MEPASSRRFRRYRGPGRPCWWRRRQRAHQLQRLGIRNVAFPATATVDIPDPVAAHAKGPSEEVTFRYDALRDGLST